MTRLISIAFTVATLCSPLHAQSTAEQIAAGLQNDGIRDVVVYQGRSVVRATGTLNGQTVEAFFSRRSGEEIQAPAHAQPARDEMRGFIEGLRETYNADTDGSFRSYVAAAAIEAGVDLPSRGPRGTDAQRPARSGDDERPGRPEREAGATDADRPSRGGPDGAGLAGPGRGETPEAEVQT